MKILGGGGGPASGEGCPHPENLQSGIINVLQRGVEVQEVIDSFMLRYGKFSAQVKNQTMLFDDIFLKVKL